MQFTPQATGWTFMSKKRCWLQRSDTPGKRIEVRCCSQKGQDSALQIQNVTCIGPRWADVVWALRGTIWDAPVPPLAEFGWKFGSTDFVSTDNWKILYIEHLITLLALNFDMKKCNYMPPFQLICMGEAQEELGNNKDF